MKSQSGLVIPQDLRVAQLFATGQLSDQQWSGIDPRMDAIGAKLVEELVTQLSGTLATGEATELLIKGKWIEGTTI